MTRYRIPQQGNTWPLYVFEGATQDVYAVVDDGQIHTAAHPGQPNFVWAELVPTETEDDEIDTYYVDLIDDLDTKGESDDPVARSC